MSRLGFGTREAGMGTLPGGSESSGSTGILAELGLLLFCDQKLFNFVCIQKCLGGFGSGGRGHFWDRQALPDRLHSHTQLTNSWLHFSHFLHLACWLFISSAKWKQHFLQGIPFNQISALGDVSRFGIKHQSRRKHQSYSQSSGSLLFHHFPPYSLSLRGS